MENSQKRDVRQWTHKLKHPDGSPYLTEADRLFKDICKKADDLIHRIQTMNNQVDICVIRVNQLEQRITDANRIQTMKSGKKKKVVVARSW